jgi:hypothetical protein
MMLASILDMSARTRRGSPMFGWTDPFPKPLAIHLISRPRPFQPQTVNGIKVVKPEKAAMIENMLISMARGGQIRGKVCSAGRRRPPRNAADDLRLTSALCSFHRRSTRSS